MVCICVVGIDVVEVIEWVFEGEGEFIIVEINKFICGIEIVFYLCEDEKEFVDVWCLCFIISKYFDYISILVQMWKDEVFESEGFDGEKIEVQLGEWEVVNKVMVLWICEKFDILDEEYNEFYKYILYDFIDFLVWVYNKVEGKMEYISLLYIFLKVLFDMWNCDQNYGLKLYV